MKISVSLFTCGVCLAPEKWKTDVIPTPYRLYYIKGGSAYFRLGGEEFKLKKGYFYLFPSSLPFIIRQDSNDRLNHLYYNFVMTPSVVSSVPVSVNVCDNELFSQYLEIMEKTVTKFMTGRTNENKDIACSVLEAFLTLFLSEKPVKRINDGDILKSIEYMETNYMYNITVREMAAQLFLNEDYFIRKFKKSIGMTPYAYLSKLRISIANELISSGMPLSEVAESTGFKYTSSLCHALGKK